MCYGLIVIKKTCGFDRLASITIEGWTAGQQNGVKVGGSKNNAKFMGIKP